MKLKDIRTEDQLFEVGNNWYERTHKLREVWQNELSNTARHKKALRLWTIMVQRCLILQREYSKALRKSRSSKEFESGGFVPPEVGFSKTAGEFVKIKRK